MQVFESMIGWFEMRNAEYWRRGNTEERMVPAPDDFRQIASSLCEKALEDAKNQLHPLVRNIELNRLDRRAEFLEAFKRALEQRVARQLSVCQPAVQSVFKYEETQMELLEAWQGPIHLLAKVPRLSNAVKAFEKRLDKCLVYCLRQLDWHRFQTCQSILDIQQVTPHELRHGISYGAMFCAVYNTPTKIWPPTA
jgi:hypothetical protein